MIRCRDRVEPFSRRVHRIHVAVFGIYHDKRHW